MIQLNKDDRNDRPDLSITLKTLGFSITGHYLLQAIYTLIHWWDGAKLP